ncbi:MAG: hypothetical protein P8M50_02005 [Paracoccaceae bacterium]|nr:hypothetical protein [Paracoccaceae bacterium]
MLNKRHEIYMRRGKNNAWLGIIMGCLVTLIFLVTIVKLSSGNKMQAFDHNLRPELVESNKKK